ncbi:hypothetical protein B5S31_g4562 [[Candida] boidinii]|nr:hypothetical protein B5S31_g4562 [[Candida] boidinii]
MSDSSSSLSRFLSNNKAAIALSAIIGVSTVAGIYYYYTNNQLNFSNSSSNSSNNHSDDSSSKKKKKSKNKKKKSNASANASNATTNDDEIEQIYPIDSTTGLPDISDELIKSLSNEDIEKYALALKESGNRYFKSKEFNKAIEFYTAALKCKIDPVFYANRSACYAALKNHEKTIEDTSLALKINPSYSKCLLRRATAYESLERYEDAMFDLTALTIYGGLVDRANETMLERVLRKHSDKIKEEKYSNLPKELPSASSLASFYGAFVPETVDLNESNYKENSPEKFVIEGINLMIKDTPEDYDKADVLFNQAVSNFNNQQSLDSLTNDEKKIAALGYEYHGAMLFLKTDSELAIENLNKSLSLLPRPRTYVILGLVFADKADFQTADSYFQKAIELNPKDPETHYHYGQLYYLMGDLQKSKKLFEESTILNPDNVYAYIQLACIAYRQGEIEQCDKLFANARKKFPASPEIPNYYGEILFDRQDFTGAMKQFEIAARLQEAVSCFSVGALPLVNKASLYMREGNYDGAIDVLAKACELDPKSEVARLQLGQIYLQKQNIDEAIKLFEEACILSRGPEERSQAISLAEAARVQLKIKQDPILSKKVEEIVAAAQGLSN